ncbi:apolipoprotein N-acyltransferase [Rhodococcus hoagii]|nr:apolipoprotein N-acyltransferase [Prescottella equi]
MTVNMGSDASGQPVPSDRVTLTIDGAEVTVPKGTLVIRAAEGIGIQIPRFCDHPLLDPVGACRQCLVEVEGQRKPLASCTTVATDGMVVRTQVTSEAADRAQKGVMELLLINHPLDCPVCDKGGECPLQNQAMSSGRAESRFDGVKRTFPKPIPLSSEVLLDAAVRAVWPLHASLPAGRRDPMIVHADADGDRTVTVAAIQGSVPRLGLDFNAQRRAVLDNHVRRTFELADDVAAGRQPQPDLVVWPENASDIDPFRNADAAEEITAASEAVGAPILVGAVLVNSDRTTTNSVIVWDGSAGAGERHDKRIIQPFGEYLPYRDFFRFFSEYADKAGNFVPGDGNGVVHADGIPVGVATCYEVAFDRALTESVRDGAELIAVPTNNATFGDTEMTYQQLAMSQVRAVEHRRDVVVAATSGVSAIIGSDGSVLQQSELFVPAALVSEVSLRTETTLATRLGPIPEYLLSLGALVALALAVVGGRRSRSTSGGHADPETDRTVTETARRGPGEA